MAAEAAPQPAYITLATLPDMRGVAVARAAQKFTVIRLRVDGIKSDEKAGCP